MDAKSYADVLKFALDLQIGYVEEEINTKPFADVERLEGVIQGLRIAKEKIESSSFLFK